MRLSDLRTGDKAVIVKVLGHGAFRRRIIEMGFIQGKTVTVELNAPLKDPIKYKIMDYEVSLRRSEASMIEVITEEEALETVSAMVAHRAKYGHHKNGPSLVENGDDDAPIEKIVKKSQRTIRIALVGNPNSGKTSLFNAASGANAHVGNYGGVTVDVKKGVFFYEGYKFVVYDLPGTYALSAYTPEEIYVRRFLIERSPDIVVNVVAASNIERNLYLTTELIDMDISMVIALNMYDEMLKQGNKLDHRKLGGMIGVPIVPTVSRGSTDLHELFDTIIRVHNGTDETVRHVHVNLGQDLEEAVDEVKEAIKRDGGAIKHVSPRYIAIKMLENDGEIKKILSTEEHFDEWSEIRDREVRRVESSLGEDVETAIVNQKYGFISGALKETMTTGKKDELQTTKIIDLIVTHKLWGFPIFIFLMWLMFEATFTVGAYPMEWIEACVGWLGEHVGNVMPDGMLRDLIVDGIIGGVGGVIVFLPNILILYLFISFMEDSGYMARAAFIMDKIMHKVGLHGKSFIPLVMGFGCNVPAIMATRTIESRSSRLITILINPFMSCSARLPIYILLIGTFFPSNGSLVFISLYVLGIVLAMVSAKLMRKFIFKKDETPFVMELPPYRMPTAKSTFIHMWDKAYQYLRKMGGIILIASIIVWFLSYFPRTEAVGRAAEENTELVAEFAAPQEQAGAGSDSVQYVDITTAPEASPQNAQNTTQAPMIMEDTFRQENSYIGRIGRFIEPAMAPLGYDWKISVALLTGAAAKEVVVSTLGVLYSIEDAEEDMSSLGERLSTPDPVTGIPPLTPVTALSLLVFSLLYFPCIASIVAIAKEAGSWKWAAFSFIYNTGIAWVAAWLVYNIGKMLL